jgi:hypothetical protein
VKASHLSLIFHLDEITRLILEAAGQPTASASPQKRTERKKTNVVKIQ